MRIHHVQNADIWLRIAFPGECSSDIIKLIHLQTITLLTCFNTIWRQVKNRELACCAGIEEQRTDNQSKWSFIKENLIHSVDCSALVWMPTYFTTCARRDHCHVSKTVIIVYLNIYSTKLHWWGIDATLYFANYSSL